jgi:tripartite-type tricarboxylate transporter receptor subunit TctC
MNRRRFLATLPAAVGMGGLVAPGRAGASDAFPDRPLRLVVGFAPGGSSDTVARLIAERLAPRLGQPVLVENKPGAGGRLGTTMVLRDPADGYQLLLLASAHSVSAAISQTLPFDPVADLEWISTAATYGMAFAVRPDSPYRSLAEMIAAAKAKPKSLSYYSVGFGTGHHLLGEWLNAATGAEFTHVPYRGSAAAFTDFAGGRVDLMIDTMTFVYPQTLGRTVRPLAVTSRQVPAELADVPFSGDVVPGLAYESWLGLAMRKGTPQGIVERLRSEVAAVVSSDGFTREMQRLGANATPSTGPAFSDRVRREIADFGRIIEARNIPRQP